MTAAMYIITCYLLYAALLVVTAGEMVPCGDIAINNRTSMCCDERVYIRHGLKPACCGMRAYDAFTHICCIEYVWQKFGRNPMCCGNRMYDETIQECSQGGYLTMKRIKHENQEGGDDDHPKLMKRIDFTIPPDDSYYVDRDYDGDTDYEYLLPTQGSGREYNVHEIRYRPIVYKTRTTEHLPTDSPINAFTDIPGAFWPPFREDTDNGDNTWTDIFNPDDFVASISPTTERTVDSADILVPIRPELEISETVTSYPIANFLTSQGPLESEARIREKALDGMTETVPTETPKYVTFPDETGTRPTYPPLLPAKAIPPDQGKRMCCALTGLNLYECCLNTLNNSVNTQLPACCSGFAVKVCCWTGEKDYSCCSRQKDCCHPEKLYQNLKRNRPNDWLAHRATLHRKTTHFPQVQPHKISVTQKPRESRKCCWSKWRPTCCIASAVRTNCCRSFKQTAPSRAIPPWQPRVRTTKTTPTGPTIQETPSKSTPSKARSTNQHNCCFASTMRPTCCSTVLIRPYCCYRVKSPRVTMRPMPSSSKRDVYIGRQTNCQCPKRSCCQNRKWPRRCCRPMSSTNKISAHQNDQSQIAKEDDTRASCCASRDPSTCCWVLYIQTSRIPRCCDQHLSFTDDKRPLPLCSDKRYNPVKDMCCSGNRQRKKGVRPRCCGESAYDAFLFYCCHGRISRSC